nr:lytic transglycosylase domain-containing protein [Limobrevibacterium gyesilva]
MRALICVATLGLLSACAGNHSQMSATQEAAQYVARAKRNYTPPGPPGDPWGPYITEAAAKYDVPERWVREVMRQESGGRLYENGQLITSGAGAMGLMQVMPATYDELRARYDLGDDPFDPHDNIMAGTAYLRELYDVFGSPGFLAAYNAGPGRLDDYLTRNRPLPDETRRYVARVGSAIGDSVPVRVAAAPQYAMLPINIPAGPRYPRGRNNSAPVALADNRGPRTGYARGVVQTAALPEPPRPVSAPAVQQVAAAAPAAGRSGFHLIAPAMADTLPTQRGGPAAGSWAIQVGAFGNESQARAAADAARGRARDLLASARPTIGTVRQASNTLYRARLTGLSRDTAMQACERISRSRGGCIVLSPDAQS